MQTDEEGFLYPVKDASRCNECGLCQRVCPIASRQATTRKKSYRRILALRSKRDDVLFKSSSGGCFYTIASHVLKQQGIVVGAAYDKHFVVRHTIAHNEKELKKLLGSKYVQSQLGDIFRVIREQLQQGTLVLFSGTPCQVDGLYHFLGKPYTNLLTLDVLCHAVPSPLIFREYLTLAAKYGITHVKDINMRNKKYVGWNPATSWGIRFKNGTYSVDDNRIINWSRLFFSEMLSRPSCHHCQYTNLDRCGDISIGDYWDWRHLHDELYCKKGTSLVFVNTESGAKLFDKLEPQFECAEITEDDSLQPCLYEPVPPNSQREQFWQDYHLQGFEYCYNKYFKNRHKKEPTQTHKEQIKQKIKEILTPGPWKFPEQIKQNIWRRFYKKFLK